MFSEDIGPRIGGTDSERRAAHYVAGQLDRLRSDTTLQRAAPRPRVSVPGVMRVVARSTGSQAC
ncbi:hypothetical protein HCA58_17090 [Micromonospora sp. HNM0581]|uniref:hypothetical protein n=1 Tax=Micromonospora sp. HNM0581 TaxID=2716341 RepID=UPI00146B84B0|nr:hypothetical protein [Micromonospora sp. HNM0581]NLU80068.1 hypothetical protein [Micromonospora sp. HNM0581]